MSHLLSSFTSLLAIFLGFSGHGIFQVNPTPTLIPKVGDTSISISSPFPGQAIQGIVPIEGDTNVAGFESGDLSFAYSNNPTNTWFHIQVLEGAAKGNLGQWDTSRIADGNYDLRMIVTLDDGRQSEVIIKGLRVRNYSTIETDTPVPEQALSPGDQITSTPLPTTPVIRLTPTPFPDNPVSISQPELLQTFGKGAVVSVVFILFIAVFGLYKKSRK